MININTDNARYHLNLLKPFQAARLVIAALQNKDIIDHYSTISKIKNKSLHMVLATKPPLFSKLHWYGGLFFVMIHSHELKSNPKRYVHLKMGAGSTVITWYSSETEAVDDLKAKGYVISKGSTSKKNV